MFCYSWTKHKSFFVVFNFQEMNRLVVFNLCFHCFSLSVGCFFVRIEATMNPKTMPLFSGYQIRRADGHENLGSAAKKCQPGLF